MSEKKSMIRVEEIENHIFLIRGHKVMLSIDLAELYGVEPRVLIQAGEPTDKGSFSVASVAPW